MTELMVLRRPRRRTHLFGGYGAGPLCGTRTSLEGGTLLPVPLAGGATVRLAADLRRELDENTCLRCTRLAALIILIYRSTDTGKPII